MLMSKRLICSCVTTTLAAVVFTVAGGTAAGGQKKAEADGAELVIQWNRMLVDTLRTPGLHPATIRVERSYAMLHVAMFDAANSVEREYTPFRVEVAASSGASPAAAAAQAAHDVLSALYPARQGPYAAALRTTLDAIPQGRARQGSRIGAAVAAEILAWRSNDGWDAPPPTYQLPSFPGYWQPTPPGFSAATFTHYPYVEPFAVASGTQFLPPAPPLLTSEAYAEAFNEVKALGAVSSATRTADQTLVARLYAGIGTRATPNTLWNGVARDVARARGLGLLDTARLFALMNVVFHDALQTSVASKFLYGLWRPVTAIRRADEDSNEATDADPGWTPLLNAPPYPTYAGNAAVLSAASARALARILGTDHIAFEVFFEPTTEGPGWTRTYTSFWQFADEQARSRVYGGIHFGFDSAVSQATAIELVDWVFERFMVPH
jgi:hypothetical protein